jgi:DNA-binding LacI/PurR family transcriptional regulator
MSDGTKTSRAKEVAAEAGVSRSAVSRAFNQKSYLEPKKRERILMTAKKLGYYPNMAARALVSNRTHLVAVVLPALRNPWESQELDVLAEELQAVGFAMLVYKIPSTDLNLDQVSHLRAYNPDSIIVYSDNLPPEGVRKMFNRSRPIFPVYVNAETDVNSQLDDRFSGLDRLIIDQRPGIKQAMQMLAGCGCKTLTWLAGDNGSQSNQDRQKIVLSQAEEFGLNVVSTIQGDYSYNTAREEVHAHFRSTKITDALFAANDVSAFGAMDALRSNLGHSIPQDIKVVGFDNISQSSWKSYDLTTVGMDLNERVRALVRLIRNRLEDPKAPDLFECVETTLTVRRTVA